MLSYTHIFWFYLQLNAVDGEGTQTAGRFRVECGEHEGEEVNQLNVIEN